MKDFGTSQSTKIDSIFDSRFPWRLACRSPFQLYNRVYAYRRDGLTTFAPLSMVVNGRILVKPNIARWAQKHLEPSCTVVSDSLDCFVAVTKIGYNHVSIVTGGGSDSVKHEEFTWINSMIGNVKKTFNGTYHTVGDDHLPRYFAEFCYRFDHHFNLASIFTTRQKIHFFREPVLPRLVISGLIINTGAIFSCRRIKNDNNFYLWRLQVKLAPAALAAGLVHASQVALLLTAAFLLLFLLFLLSQPRAKAPDSYAPRPPRQCNV